jgi:hypothetical protein
MIDAAGDYMFQRTASPRARTVELVSGLLGDGAADVLCAGVPPRPPNAVDSYEASYWMIEQSCKGVGPVSIVIVRNADVDTERYEIVSKKALHVSGILRGRYCFAVSNFLGFERCITNVMQSLNSGNSRF